MTLFSKGELLYVSLRSRVRLWRIVINSLGAHIQFGRRLGQGLGVKGAGVPRVPEGVHVPSTGRAEQKSNRNKKDCRKSPKARSLGDQAGLGSCLGETGGAGEGH